MADGLLIVGVGRSGTSIAAQLATEIGLRAPRSSDLMKANAANPGGYWESQALAVFNDRLLARWGNSWWRPPSSLTAPMLSGLADATDSAAERFAESFGAGSGWVWKDPRLAILLPFWEGVLGEQPILFPHRAPQDVARSIAARDGVSYQQGLAIWERHTRLALTSLAGRRVRVTDYSQLRANPGEWLVGLRTFCLSAGLSVVPPAGSPDRHVRPPMSSSEGWRSPEHTALVALLQQLEGDHEAFPSVVLPVDAGWADEMLHGVAPPSWTTGGAAEEREAYLEDHRRIVEERERLLAEQEAYREDHRRIVEERERLLAEWEAYREDHRRIVEERERLLAEHALANGEAVRLTTENAALREQLRGLRGTLPTSVPGAASGVEHCDA